PEQSKAGSRALSSWRRPKRLFASLIQAQVKKKRSSTGASPVQSMSRSDKERSEITRIRSLNRSVTFAWKVTDGAFSSAKHFSLSQLLKSKSRILTPALYGNVIF